MEREQYQRHNFFRDIFLLVGLFLASAVLSQLLILPLAANLGMANMEAALAEMQAGRMLELLNPLRIVLSFAHAFTFLVPAAAFALLIWRPAAGQNLYLKAPNRGIDWLLGLLFVAVILPATGIIHYLNTLIPEAWHHTSGRELQNLILKMNTPVDLLLNILLIGVMAGVGEELMFRGVLQRIFGVRFKNIHIAVWLTAILFSLVHLEMQAFLPRVILGAAFGYICYWSGSLWVPIILHFIYNSMQVVAVYMQPEMINEEASAPNLTTIIVAIAGAGAATYIAIRSANGVSDEARSRYFDSRGASDAEG